MITEQQVQTALDWMITNEDNMDRSQRAVILTPATRNQSTISMFESHKLTGGGHNQKMDAAQGQRSSQVNPFLVTSEPFMPTSECLDESISSEMQMINISQDQNKEVFKRYSVSKPSETPRLHNQIQNVQIRMSLADRSGASLRQTD